MTFLIYLGCIYLMNAIIFFMWLVIFIDVEHSDQENLADSIIKFFILGAFIDALTAVTLSGASPDTPIRTVILVNVITLTCGEVLHLTLLPFDVDTSRCCNWRVLHKRDEDFCM